MKKEPLFLILAVFLLLFANVGLWLSQTIYNPDNFSILVVETYKQPEVRDAIASQVVDRALEDKPLVRQVLGDPIESAISGILDSQSSEKFLQKFAIRFQGYITKDEKEDVTLEVGQLSAFVKAAAGAVSPELGKEVPTVLPQTITLIESESLPDVDQWLRPILSFGPIAGFVSLVVLIYLIYTSLDKTKMIKTISLYSIIGIFIFSLTIPYLRSILQGSVNTQNAQIVATATYDAFASVMLRQLTLLAIFFGIIYLGVLIYLKRRNKKNN